MSKDYSMHEISEIRNCKNCFFGDRKALEHNEKAHNDQRWDDMKPYCTFAFRLDLAGDWIKCNTWKPKHPRACPKCGKIIPWTKGEDVFKDGKRIGFKALLVCPEDGEFRNAAEAQVLNKLRSLKL